MDWYVIVEIVLFLVLCFSMPTIAEKMKPGFMARIKEKINIFKRKRDELKASEQNAKNQTSKTQLKLKKIDKNENDSDDYW